MLLLQFNIVVVKLPQVKHGICFATLMQSGARCDNPNSWVLNVDKPGLPVAVRDKIMPSFQDLSKTELLEKCHHCKVQNCNEALNALIWNRLPKEIFVGPYVLEMGVCSAVLSFNSGTSAMLRIFEELGMTSGYYARKFCNMKNENRINKMERKMSVEGKSDRKRKRAIKKGFQVLVM